MKKLRLLAVILAMLMLLSTFTLSVSAAPDYRLQLAELIAEAEQEPAPGGNYNSATVSALSDALEEARVVYLDKEATDEKLKEQISKLDSALYGLETYNWYTKGLWNAIEYAKSINPEDYTKESYDALSEAYSNNQLIIYFPSSQEEIDEATDKINNAIANLVPVGDATTPVETAKDKLFRFVNQAEHHIYNYKVIYSDKSIDDLSDAYDYGKELLNNNESSETVLNAATETIENAINALVVYTWDFQVLDAAMKNARQFQREAIYFTEESMEALSSAYNRAESIKHSAQSQREVDDAAINLINATSQLEQRDTPAYPEETAESRYRQLLFDANQYSHVYADSYTEVSYRALINAINEANKIEFGQRVTDEEYNNASAILEEAIANLEFKSTEAETTTVDTEATELSSLSSGTTETTAPTTNPAETSATVTEPVENTTTATEPPNATFDEPEKSTVNPVHTETVPETTTEAKKTTASETAADTTPNETIILALYYTLGDADQNSKVNIKDATAVQKHIAKLTTLSEIGHLAGDTTEDGKLNIKDATEIQKHIANLPSNENIGKKFSTENTPAETTAIPFSTEIITETVTQAETTATEASSQDEIPVATTAAVDDVTEPEESVAIDETLTTDATETTTEPQKTTETTINETNAETTTAENTTESVTETETTENIEETTETLPISDEITLYFTNSQNWENVNIHFWSEKDDSTTWPGIPMEFVETNPYSQDVYKITVPAYISGVVFNAGMDMPQTEDVLKPFENNDGFYPTELKENKWAVGTYKYDNKSEATEIEFKVVKDERIYEGYGSEQTMFFVVNDSSDTEYKTYIKGESPEIDADSLAERGKSLIVMLTFIGSGSNTQVIEKVELENNTTLNIVRKLNTSILGTADMNYRFVAIEVNSADIKNITDFTDSVDFAILY